MSQSCVLVFVRSVGSCLLLTLMVSGCGGGKGPGSNPVEVESLASFEVTAVSPCTAGEEFLLTVTAVGDQGSKPLSSFSGTVSLAASSGSINPNSLSLNNGRASVSVTLVESGNTTLTATAQGKTGSLTMEVAQEFVLEGEIAFWSDRSGEWELWVMSGDSPDPVRLTDNAGDWGGVPRWSPDGTRITYESKPSGNNEIYVVNTDGTGEVNVTNNPEWDGRPGWSPDGSKIVFQSDRDGDPEIYLMNADGTGVTQATFTGNESGNKRPKWSPDGSRIAYFKSGNVQGGVFSMDPDGTDHTRLTGIGRGYHNWSPDGSRIVLMGAEGATNLWLVNADGSGLSQLTNSSRSDYEPLKWSPDGSKIAFNSSFTENQSGLFIINSDGSGLRMLTDEYGPHSWISWSPDSKWIVFESNEDVRRRILVVNVASGAVTMLSPFNVNDRHPEWRKSP